MNICELFKNIKNEPRTTIKVKMLQAYENKDELKQALIYAYSNKEIFGLTSSSIRLPYCGICNDIDFTMFEKLKTISGRNAKISLVTKECNRLSSDACNIVKNIIDKDLNIGINRKLINRAFGYELIPDFALMLAFKQDEKRWVNAFNDCNWCYYNVKVDGIRCVCEVHSKDEIHFFSRDGKELQGFLTERIKDEIIANIDIFEGMVLDGEISSSYFQKLMRIVNRKNVTMDSIFIRNSVKFSIFDLIHIENEALHNRVYVMESIEQQLPKSHVIKFLKYHKVKCDYNLIASIARIYIDKGAEGIIIKNPATIYERKRSNYWLKFKDKNTEDLKVIGYYEGENGTQFEGSLGGLILKYKNTKLRCGSGFSETERYEFWQKRKDLIDKIVEISYMEETKTGSLRHPVFERFRFDKEGAYE